jgi:hypothetical protein
MIAKCHFTNNKNSCGDSAIINRTGMANARDQIQAPFPVLGWQSESKHTLRDKSHPLSLVFRAFRHMVASPPT